jgi:tRNA threonylcarbamoyladenosine biosynthesis protein TsaE
MKFKIRSNSEQQTLKLAKLFASKATPKMVFLLSGNLGAGKTVFAQGFASGLNVKEIVNSPTFNIVKVYTSGRLPLYHIDAYRLEGNNKDIGLEEYIEAGGISLIEWPEYVKYILPKNKFSITIKNISENEREIEIEASGEKEIEVLTEVKKLWVTN